MPATITDFQNVSDTSADLCDQWVVMARALQGLGAFFSQKIATGTEPDDVLHGVNLGISGQSTTFADWRVLVDASNNLDIDENTGTDASPTWVNRFTLPAGGLTASRALVTDGSGIPSVATTTATEIGYVNGVTSAIQTQLDARVLDTGDTMTGRLVNQGNLVSAMTNSNIRLFGYSPALELLDKDSITNWYIGIDDDDANNPLWIGRGYGPNQGSVAAAIIINSSDMVTVSTASTASRALVTNGSGQLSVATTTATEIGYVNGVTSAIQTQLNGKEPTVSLTASRAVVSDGGGALAAATTTSTEIGYVNGVTSAIQTQLDAKLALAGGTMTGKITLDGDPTAALHAATKQYVDAGGGSGGTALLSHQTFSSVASVDFDADLPSSGYTFFRLMARIKPDTDNVELGLRVDTDGGASYETTSYSSQVNTTNSSASVISNSATDRVLLASRGTAADVGNDSNLGFQADLIIFPGDGTLSPYVSGTVAWYQANDDLAHGTVYGYHSTATRIDSLQLLASSGNIDGEATLIGYINA